MDQNERLSSVNFGDLNRQKDIDEIIRTKMVSNDDFEHMHDPYV